MEENNQTDLEDVIQEVENEEQPVEEVVEEKPELDLSKFDSAEDPSVIKVDLSNPNNETEESNTDDAGVVRVDEDAEPAQSEDEVQPQGEVQEEVPTLEEVTEEQVEDFKEEVADAIEEAEATGSELPENVKKLIDFMADTGGDLEDYVVIFENLLPVAFQK